MAYVDRNYQKILAARKRKRIGRRFVIILRILLMAGLFAGFVWGFNYFYNSSYFKIDSIIVTGNEKYAGSVIKKEADVALGKNIFEVEKKEIEDRLADKLVWLKSASLKKVFPNKIEIIIMERKPYVIIVFGGHNYIIDEEGIVLEEVGSEDLKTYNNLVVVKNAMKYNPSIGEMIAKKNVLSCGIIYNALDLELKAGIKEAYIDNNYSEDIIFLTIQNKRIIFGTSDRIEDKNALLRKIFENLDEQKVSYSLIDLRNVDSPVIK